MTGVRYGELGFEGRCDGCSLYWPLDAEFWPRGRGLRHCRACEQELMNLRARVRRDAHVAYNRAWRAANRDSYNAKVRDRQRLRKLSDPAYLERQRKHARESMRRSRAA